MSHPRHTLPLSTGEFLRFVGRERDIVDLCRLLGTARLVTLTGTGGIGKTRLALHVAERLLRRFPDGTRFIDLSESTCHEQALRTVANGLQAVEDDARTVTESIITALRTQNTLLLLDTCEYAIGPMAQLCQAILRDCPRVRILVTSRQPLHVPEENIWRVPPLSLPTRPTPTDPYASSPAPLPRRDIQRYESVRLFVTRAHAARSGFEMTRENSGYVAEICRMLDGMPLAIELAAARVRVLSVQQILRRLDDRFQLLTSDGSDALPPRQRTLRAVLSWSHELLSEPERLLLHRLSAFTTWYLEAAEEVCSGEGVDPTEVLPLHFSLLDKSLIVMDVELDGRTHYRLPETVRAYAAEQLAAEGDAELYWGRYLDYAVGQVQRDVRRVRDPQPWPERVGRLRLYDHHRDNIGRLVGWALSHGRPDDALRLVTGLRTHWNVRGLAAEGSWLIERCLDTGADDQDPHLRALALALHAELRLDLDPPTQVTALARCALESARACRAPEAAATALTILAQLALRSGELDESERHATAAWAWAERSRDPVTEGAALEVSALLARRRGDGDTALLHLKRRTARAEELDDQWSRARGLHLLGVLAAERREFGPARTLMEEGLEIFTHLEANPAAARCSRALGRLHLSEGRPVDAREPLATSLRVSFASGQRIAVARALEALAELALAEEEAERAAALVGSAAELRASLQRPSAETVRLRSAVERAVGHTRAAEGWEAWRSLPLEQVRDRALAFPVAGEDEPRVEELTRRESEIAELAGQGLSNREIGSRLSISQSTAARHIANIFRKLSISSRRQLTGWVSRGEAGPP
ncbi:LuxR C-terminal-related transcriptional regulator [Nocardiopsis salina]|uniref:LuxR C-terminal-related transcriptional regulator n=1 Tax=Nocardiopsis salina TaxID=245836 RepID=UPI0003782F9F|nr:LuxR C-terminal-related transcriptional regulator [Nocardiopsis salina]